MKILRVLIAIIGVGLMLAVALAAIASLYGSGYSAGSRQCEVSYQGNEEPETIGPI